MSDDVGGFMCGPNRRNPNRAEKAPPLAERSRPGLSATLAGPRAPQFCQGCGLSGDPDDRAALELWEESDEWDRWQDPPVLIVLCPRCSKREINRHARLYRQVDRWAPNLGAMGLCVGCKLRSYLVCRAPAAKQNGGAGLEVTYVDEPKQFHLKAQGFSGYRWLYSGPVIKCAGRTDA